MTPSTLLPTGYRPLAVFAVWTVTSFLCHKLAKTAINTSSWPPLTASLLVTLVQVLCCLATVRMTSARRGTLYYVTMTSHVLATLATNVSLSMTWATCTLAVKMLEPLSSALLQRMMLSSRLPPHTTLTTLVIVAGAALYVFPFSTQPEPESNGLGVTAHDDVSDGGDVVRAAALALLSNVTLGVRNVALKLVNHNNDGQPALQFRSRSTAVTVVIGFVIVFLPISVYVQLSTTTARDNSLVPAAISPQNHVVFLTLAAGSGLFHVAYSYVSTNVVLRYMSVLSHALLNICKRMLVVLLLHVMGRRRASLWNWAGLALSFAGLLWYQRQRAVSKPPSSHHAELGQGSKESDHTAFAEDRQASHLSKLLVTLCFVFVFCVAPITPLLSFTRLQQPVPSGYTSLGYIDPLHRDSLLDVEYQRVYSETTGTQSLFSPITNLSCASLNKTKVTDYAMRLYHGYEKYIDGKPLLPELPVRVQPERKTLDVGQFLSRRLLTSPFDTDALSPYLTSSSQVIAEAQRIHLNMYKDLLAGRKYAILLDLATHENKGDAAISVGEIVFLQKLGIQLVYYVDIRTCTPAYINHAFLVAQKYPKDELVILYHGGGNIIGYQFSEWCRKKTFEKFRGFYLLFFPQSIFLRGTEKNIADAVALYCCNTNLTLVLRDRQSLTIGLRLFNKGTRIVMAPDMAFNLGRVPRHISPYYDILWLERKDGESKWGVSRPAFPSHVRVQYVEWRQWLAPKGDNGVAKAVNQLHLGYDILQQGRVVVTERLHGHILCLLLDIPHVLLDNDDRKLSSYYNTWTRGVDIARVTTRTDHAAQLALQLLDTFRDRLPARITAVDIQESPTVQLPAK